MNVIAVHINRRLEIKKSVGVYAGLLQDRTERPFGHVTWVIRDRRIAIIAGVVPDLMATRSLSIKLESTSLELSYYVAITQAGESAHLRGHHYCVFASTGSRWQWNITFSFPSRFNELASDVAGDVEGLRDCTALRHQTPHFVRGREIDALGQRLNLDLNSEFHSINVPPLV